MDEEIVIPQKTATIRVPKRKFHAMSVYYEALLNGVWPPPLGTEGRAAICLYDDFESGDKVVFLEGDHHIIEPVIQILMCIVLSKDA